MKQIVLTVALSMMASIVTAAQSVTTVRVARVTAVLEQPAGDARSLGSVAVGEVLDVLDERDGWFLVRPPAGGSPHTWRTGWLSAMTVVAMDRGAVAADGQAARPTAAEPEKPKSNRKGFIIGAGAGGGLHSAPGFDVFDRFGRLSSVRGGTNNFAIGTNFMVGYAPTDQTLLFYSNRATFTTDENIDALGVTGFGATYMFRPTAPTGYVTGSIGGGFGASIYQRTASDAGLGWSAGAGWEFLRHLALEGDVLVVRLGDGENHTVYRTLLTYTFY
jgi:hypothetical protein